ncbi:MAG TPA: 2'-5' RNA ligase family protein [Acidimicrobiales bacterium]|nr:2'-5' RNA ligase family protein [Acidimicrobiales bacterium]
MRARCFVAVEAPPGLVGQLGGLERPARAGLRWTEPHQWHVTLCFVGSAEPDRVVAALPPELPGPVEALAGPRPVALSRHVWALPVSGLDLLASTVADRLSELMPPPARPFRGHLTLARARRPAALDGLPRPDLTWRWDVGSVVAYRSELHPSGARYHELGRWAVARR